MSRWRSLAWMLAALVSAGPAAGQTTRRELDALRAQLELPAQVKLAPATELVLPPARPLRVRLAFGLDIKARENVARWIGEWNRKDGARLGTLELVDEGSAPVDVVLARVTDREKVRTRTVTGPDLGPSGPGTSTNRSSTRSRFEIQTIPVSAYILDSRGAEQWSIVWRHTGYTTLEESNSSGRELWDGLKEMLKKRKER